MVTGGSPEDDEARSRRIQQEPTSVPAPDPPRPAVVATPATASGRLTPLREMQLVEAHQEGDPAAIGTLLREYQRRIYGVCARMVRQPEEAADLTQESMIKVLEGLSSYDGRAAVSTWIIRVTMNCCLSHLRKERLRRHGSLDDREPAGDGPGRGNWVESEEPPPARGVEREEQRQRLLAALAELEPPMRAVIVLRDLQGLDYQQIGVVLGVPVGTVKSRLFRARLALRALLDRGPEPRGDSIEDVDRDELA